MHDSVVVRRRRRAPNIFGRNQRYQTDQALADGPSDRCFAAGLGTTAGLNYAVVDFEFSGAELEPRGRNKRR